MFKLLPKACDFPLILIAGKQALFTRKARYIEVSLKRKMNFKFEFRKIGTMHFIFLNPTYEIKNPKSNITD